jgi:hypothetical protein
MKLGVALLVVAPCLAQGTLTLVPPSELARERERLEEAWKQWQAGDARLERQLFSRPPEKVLPEIDRGERNALSYYRHRRRYLEGLLGSFHEQIRELETPVATRSESLRELGDTRKLEVILEEQAKLLEGARSGQSAGRLLDAEEQARQLERLRALADKIEAQRKIVRLLEETEREQAKARAALVHSYREIAELLERQLELNEQKQDLWRQYYDDLRRLVAPQAAAPVRKKEN